MKNNKKKVEESVENTPKIEKIESGEDLAGGSVPPPKYPIDPDDWGSSGMRAQPYISIKEA